MWADALPNLLIGLREGLEGGLVVSILLAAVRRIDQNARTSPVWLGVAAAVVLALSFGAVLTFYRAVLPTTGQEALSGSLSVVAVVLVTGMIFWMRRTARGLSGELRAKVGAALLVSGPALVLTAFLAVAREGLETSLFLMTTAQASGQTVAPLIGAVIGIGVAVVLCVLLFRSTIKIRLDLFFNRTAVLLIVIAAGVLAYGLRDLQDAGLLPGHTWIAFDLSGVIDPSAWWMTVITGVTELAPVMTWLQVIAYVGYLATVLTLFARAKAAAPAPAEPKPVRTPPRWATAGAMVLPPLIAAALIAFAPGRSTAGPEHVDVTAAACAPGWSAGPGGARTFGVANKSGHTVEVMLVQNSSRGVVAEIETLGPATTQTVAATLTAGDYSWQCRYDGLPATTSATARLTGGGGSGPPPLVRPITAADLAPAVRAYNAYAATRLTQLAGQVTRLRTDLAAGSVPAAQRDWLPAQLTWEQVGAAYGSFAELGTAIDGLPQGLPGGVDDPGFTGLHRLEYGLWHGQPAAALLPVADRLAADLAALRAKLPQVTLDPADLPLRAHEILEDALRDHLSGATDFGAHAAYPETAADVSGTRVVLTELAPLLDPRSPRLLATAGAQLDTLDRALSSGARQPVNAALGASLETLAVVPDLLELPAHG